MCEELRKRMDVCCLQKARWRGQGGRFTGVKGRTYKLWWYGNSDGTGGVGVLVKEELCEKVVEVRRKSDRVGKRKRKYVKVIPGEVQHRLGVLDLVKKKVKKDCEKESD